MPADEQYVEGSSLSGGTVESINQKKLCETKINCYVDRNEI